MFICVCVCVYVREMGRTKWKIAEHDAWQGSSWAIWLISAAQQIVRPSQAQACSALCRLYININIVDILFIPYIEIHWRCTGVTLNNSAARFPFRFLGGLRQLAVHFQLLLHKQFPAQCINTFDCLSKFPTGFSQQQQHKQQVKHIKSTLAHRASYAFDCKWRNK